MNGIMLTTRDEAVMRAQVMASSGFNEIEAASAMDEIDAQRQRAEWAETALTAATAQRVAESERADANAALCEKLREAWTKYEDAASAEMGSGDHYLGQDMTAAIAEFRATLKLAPSAALAERDARVRAEERERCAKVADDLSDRCSDAEIGTEEAYQFDRQNRISGACYSAAAAAIRALPPSGGPTTEGGSK